MSGITCVFPAQLSEDGRVTELTIRRLRKARRDVSEAVAEDLVTAGRRDHRDCRAAGQRAASGDAASRQLSQ
ncbi:hypothetical protein PANT111_30112 [Pantoea brenneri]|uniref:Uncharacterized protein n=1 Tax=Pantoea brenneri TaxID=472694 RepID=A0AAX3J9F9_9GAMM|nr:hypothetical protein PANT111_30112 [Pantoea brenneri]